MSDGDSPWPATEDDRRLQRFREAMRNKWGFGETRAADLYAAFDGRAVAAVPGFEAVAPGRHVRRIDPDIVQLLRLAPYKGGLYRVQFGAVLPFMPVATSGRLRRPDLGARIVPMLWDEPPWRNAPPSRGVLGALSRVWRAPSDPLLEPDLVIGVETSFGRGGMEYTLAHHWQRSLPLLSGWFARNATLAGLLETARQQCIEPGSAASSPNPRLVMAFLLARLGREGEARVAFEGWQREEREASRDELHPAWGEKLLSVGERPQEEPSTSGGSTG